MLIHASCILSLSAEKPVTSVFMLRPKSGAGQFVVREEFHTEPFTSVTEYIDGYGNLCQRIVIPTGQFTLSSRVTVDCAPEIDVDMNALWAPVEQVPDNILQFLLPSRYCESDKLGRLALDIAAGLTCGYPQVEAIREWINRNFTYRYGSSDNSTSALDVSHTRIGVCRDYAHLGIALCRFLDIPARMVVGYLHGLEPMDLHAWFEAFVGGRWYTFDATQSTPRGRRIALAYGRDAADVAFATHFQPVKLERMEVRVSEE